MKLERDAQSAQEQLKLHAPRTAVAYVVDDVKRRWRSVPEVTAWLDALPADVIGDLATLDQQPPLPASPRRNSAGRYEVDVFVTNAPDLGAPVVAVHDAGFYDLFGRIE